MADTHKPRLIVAAAIMSDQGIIVVGPRHFDEFMVRHIEACGLEHEQWSHQGFIDNSGTFFDREDAYRIAKKAKQIRYPLGHHEGILYSEMLY